MAKTLTETDLEQASKDTLIEAKVNGERWLWRKIWNGTGYSWDTVRRLDSFTQAQIAKLKPRLATEV